MAALLCTGSAHATIAMAGQPDLRREVQPTGREATLSFQAPFELAHASHVYFKVLPSPGNPVLLNGTPEDGWWTHVRLEGPQQTVIQQGTNGSATVHFGVLEANTTYWLHLGVRVPTGELAHPQEHAMRYAVAARSTGGTGSGGQLDQSVGIKAVIVVSPDAEVSLGEQAQAQAWFSWPIAGIAALAAAAAGVVGLVLRRRR